MTGIPKSILILLGAVCTCAAVHAGDAPIPPEQLEFFEKKIRPVLIERCYSCHSAESGKKLQGNLYLDSRQGWSKGGDNGPAIVPGQPEKSLVIRAINYKDDELTMPPKQKLTDEQIADITAWIKMGAPDPRVGKAKVATTKIDASKHWAYKVPQLPSVPEVKNKKWVRTPVDNFVLAKLDAKKLKPSPPIDKRALLRRATFDLTGLPPTPQELADFENDKAPEAYAKAIDRLLASPHYGERWGRHWLDVARYADTKGYVFQEERRYPYSYTYRDWVVRAFNADMPYDQFVLKQIAADVLVKDGDKRDLAALGFLTVGRRFINNINDIIDDRIDVVSRGLMGLTVGCARCHDHKYDPIPTRDYYALYGVFASSQEPKDLPDIGNLEELKKNPQFAEYEKQVAAKKKEVVDYIDKRCGEILDVKRKPETLTQFFTALYESPKPDHEVHGFALKKDVNEMLLHLWRAQLKAPGERHKSSLAVWKAFAEIPANEFAAKAPGALQAAAAKGPLHPLLAQEFAKAPASMAEFIQRFVATLSKYNSKTPLPNADEETLRQLLPGMPGPFDVTVKRDGPEPNTAAAEQLFKRDDHDKIRNLRNQVEAVHVTHAGAPPRAMILAEGNPHNVAVFVRGNPGNRGEVAPRQFLTALSAGKPEPFKQGSGRLELAQRIAAKDNPLTARVIVNRVWTQHFGLGLVRTPSDFGVRTEAPVHQELLDYLACQFVQDGWSLKKLHRLIMLSNTYQQRSDDVAESRAADPENTLVWRMNRRRLDFEAMRDALLFTAGRLDLTLFGRPVELFQAPFTARRTIYGYIDRQNLPGTFRTFDFASPDMHSPQRYQTTVPQQALYMLNSPFVIEQARAIAGRSEIKTAPDDKERIARLYAILFGRKPSSDEIKAGQAYVAEAERTNQGPPVAAEATWQYGYGAYDEATRQVKFTKLPHFTGQAWQGGVSVPDAKLGWTLLTREGGHPGDKDHCVIRRWTAPRDGTFNIDGELSHAAKEGNGVLGRIISSRLGELGKYVVHTTKLATDIAKFEAQRGDTIDFLIDCQTDVGYDSFSWAPVVTQLAPPTTDNKWDATANFHGPNLKPAEYLKPWERYAQVLLQTNEFLFVD